MSSILNCSNNADYNAIVKKKSFTMNNCIEYIAKNMYGKTDLLLYTLDTFMSSLIVPIASKSELKEVSIGYSQSTV